MRRRIRDIRKRFFNTRIYDVDKIFEFAGNQKVRLEIEKGVVVRIESHLFNSIIWGKSIATSHEKMRDLSEIDYYNKLVSAFGAFYSDLLVRKDYDGVIKFDMWLGTFGLIANASVNSQGKWVVKFEKREVWVA